MCSSDLYKLKFTKKGYQPQTVKNVTVPPDQEVDVEMQAKSRSAIAWVVPPSPEMAAGKSQTVRWRVTGEEVTGTALACSASGDPTAEATETIPGVEVAPGEYKATIRPVSPGAWRYAAVAQVDGDTVATKPVAVTVK